MPAAEVLPEAARTVPARRAMREGRIDLLRGWAILVILINHLSQVVELGGVTQGLIPTPTQYGYSTAAELFVFLSGYMVGLVYLHRPRPARTVWHRAGRLWVYDLALLVLILPLMAAMPPNEIAFWRLGPFLDEPAAALFRFATLQEAPRLLDVLQLYVKLMLLAPIAIWIHRRSPLLLVTLSAGIYLSAQALTIQRLAASADARTDGLLDLMSWQALFFVPMALGAWRIHMPLFRWLEGRWAVFAALLLTVVAAGVARRMQMAGLLAPPEWLTGRYGLNVLRLGHALLMLLFYASALTLARPWLERGPLPAIGRIGRHSLDCFAGGVLITYGLGVLWSRFQGGHAGYYAFAVLGIALTLWLARWRDHRKARPAPAN